MLSARPTRIDAHVGMIAHETSAAGTVTEGTVVPSHAVDGDGNGHPLADKRKGRQFTMRGSYLPNPEKSLARTLDHLLAPIKTRRADVMPQMNLASRRFEQPAAAPPANRAHDACHAWMGISCSVEQP
jgi:hypothetical protein